MDDLSTTFKNFLNQNSIVISIQDNNTFDI
nr:MAG TPA: hypothetical protein [Caudoviricetes sp.]